MAKVFISEYARFGHGLDPEYIVAVAEPALAEQGVAFDDEDPVSAAFSANTRVIRVVADAACHIAVGADPEADTDSKYLPANTVEYFAVTPGHKLSVSAAEVDGD